MSEQFFTVRYHHPLMGTYQTKWVTEERAMEEAEYDHWMNGAPVEVIDPSGNIIRTYKDGSVQ